MQEIFSLVLFGGFVFYYYFQYPTRKFPSSTEFQEFWELKYKISNSGSPVSFLGQRRDGKWPVLNGQELDGTGSGLSRVLGTGNFPDFFGKNLVPGKWYSGMQTSTIYLLFFFLFSHVVHRWHGPDERRQAYDR